MQNEPLLLPSNDQPHFQKKLLEDASKFYWSKCSIECVNIEQFQLEVDAFLMEEEKLMQELNIPISVEEHLSKIREVSFHVSIMHIAFIHYEPKVVVVHNSLKYKYFM